MHHVAKALLFLCLLHQLAALSAMLGGQLVWWLDLANHLTLFAACSALVGTVIAWTVDARRLMTVLALCALLQAGRWAAPWVMGPSGDPERATAAPQQITLLVANVYSGNYRSDLLTSLVADEAPDIVGLLEVDSAWLDRLGDFRDRWPHRLEIPRPDNFGIALYSRIPLSGTRRFDLGQGSVPSIRATLPGGTTLWLTHPVPPVNAVYAAERDAQLTDLADILAAPSVIVAGDLNATPWSAWFPGSFRGLPEGTWPSHLPAALRLPIDHVLVSSPVALVSRRVGPDIGSDHLPVITRLVLPSDADEAGGERDPEVETRATP